MLTAISTLIMMLVVILFPVLIPATVSAFHVLTQLRRRRTQPGGDRDRIGYVVEPVAASA
jgi:hypothetical protein